MPSDAILQWAALTRSGSRKTRNDDSLIAFASGPTGAEILPESGIRTISTHDLVFAVADGMGGGNAGDLASSMLLRQMSEVIPETFKAAAAGFFPDHLEHLENALRSVHEHINRGGEACENHRGMAATVALAWFTPENLYLANVGDSRIYLSRHGVLEQLSRDHTAAWGQWKRGEIGEAGYRSHPRRSSLFEVVGGGHTGIFPHFAAVPYQAGDRILICTDGVIDGLWERPITNALATCPADPSGTANALINRAVDNAGLDDTTLIVITVSVPEKIAD